MTRLQPVALVLIALCAGPADAGPAGLKDGIYDATDCAAKFSDTRLTLSGDNLSFYESACTLSNPQGLRDFPGAVLLDASCQGEGETWTYRFILMQTRDGGMALLQEGWGDHYALCQ